ncbi:hypothetical protein [Vibrio spartinae]|uniref:Uncharacterized protein n=1 Tax=Vibrio spartinae TaxID=1918945 RepID=A0A1N6MAF7_9VIBR|nr:hypothetical protein [Vibrio spartinae]SIO96320.1 hypothetical protein VSP9026_04104 [Vibrio spartinae]
MSDEQDSGNRTNLPVDQQEETLKCDSEGGCGEAFVETSEAQTVVHGRQEQISGNHQVITGNAQVHYHQSHSQGEWGILPEHFKNPIRVLPFPKKNNNMTFEDCSLLNGRRCFYKSANWIVIESNRDNYYYISEAIANLIEEESNSQYSEQPPFIQCQHYLNFSKRFYSDTSQFVKLVVDDLKAFRRFIETRENLKQLSDALTSSNNTLLLIVERDEENDQVDAIAKLIGQYDRMAYWSPRLTQPKDEEISVLEQDNLLRRVMFGFVSWFTVLPSNVFHALVTDYLEYKCRQTLFSEDGAHDAEDVSLLQWRKQWSIDPDALLRTMGLKQSRYSMDVHGIGLADGVYRQRYQDKLVSGSPYMLSDIVRLLTDKLFKMENYRVEHTEGNLLAELARFYVHLNEHGILTLNTDYLLDMFAKYRFATTQSKHTIFRYVEFLSYLYKHPQIRPVLYGFVEALTKRITNFEPTSADSLHWNIGQSEQATAHSTLSSLASQTAAPADDVSENLIDLVYATFNVVTWSIGIGDVRGMQYLEQILDYSGKLEAYSQSLNSKTLYHLFCGRLYCSADDYLRFTNMLITHRAHGEVRLPHLDGLARTFFQSVCDGLCDFSSEQASFYKDLNYLYAIVSVPHAYPFLCRLLVSENHKADQCVRSAGEALITLKYQIATLKQTVDPLNKDAFEQLESVTEANIKTLLSQLASELSRQNYQKVKNSYKHQVDQARELVYQSDNKLIRVRYREYRQACYYISKHFRRVKEGG